MKIHLRVDTANDTHTRFTCFVNGASAGQLCLRADEFKDFATILRQGMHHEFPEDGEFKVSVFWGG